MAKSQTYILGPAWAISMFGLRLLHIRFTFSKLVWVAMVLGVVAVYLTVYAIIKAIEKK